MNREQLCQRIANLTETEQAIRDGRIAAEEAFAWNLRNARRDDNGYYFFSNEKMRQDFSLSGPNSAKLRQTLFNARISNNLRVLVHSRFSRTPFHYNEFVSINYVRSGRMWLRFPGKELVLEQGQLILMNANVVHAFRLEKEEDVVLGVQLQTDYFREKMLRSVSGNSNIAGFLMDVSFGKSSQFDYVVVDCREDDRVQQLLENILCEFMEPSVYSPVLVQCYTECLFVALMQNTRRWSTLREHGSLAQILHYIEENSRTVTLQDLAREFSYQPKYISALIKRKTGRSFSDLLTQIRMEKVRELLAATGYPVRLIAEECGYNNITFFYARFRELYGMSPREYRAQAAAQESENGG